MLAMMASMERTVGRHVGDVVTVLFLGWGGGLGGLPIPYLAISIAVIDYLTLVCKRATSVDKGY